jgi:hypothetical protein
MGGTEVGKSRHRSWSPISIAAPGLWRRSTRSRLAAAAPGVRLGSKPSGGSVRMEVRRLGRISEPVSNRLKGSSSAPRVFSCNLAACSGVKNGWSFSRAGRSSGMAVAELQAPSKSGCTLADRCGVCAVTLNAVEKARTRKKPAVFRRRLDGMVSTPYYAANETPQRRFARPLIFVFRPLCRYRNIR